jgi:hypothetical protein
MYLDDINRKILSFKIIYLLFSLFLIVSLILYISMDIYPSQLIQKRNNEIQFSDCLYLLTAFAVTCFLFSIIAINLNKGFIFSIFNIILVSGLMGCIGYYYYLTYGMEFLDNYPGVIILSLTVIILISSILILYYEHKKKNTSKNVLGFFQDAEPKKYERSKDLEPKDALRVAESTYKTIQTYYPDYFKLNKCDFLMKYIDGERYVKGDQIDNKDVNDIYNQIAQHLKCPLEDKKELAYFLAKKYHTAEDTVGTAKEVVDNKLFTADKYKNFTFN